MAMVIPEPGGTMPEDSPNTATTAMLVVASVIGGIAVILCTVAVYLYIVKRKQLKRDLEALRHLTEIETAPLPRQRKRNNSGLSDEEETCRTHMIRKSLARRNSNSTGSGFSAVVGMIDREVAEIERHESARLRDDWKEWEARVRQERSMSGEQHPATNAPDEAPGGVPVLTTPTPERLRSPALPPLGPVRSPPPIPQSPNLPPPSPPSPCSTSPSLSPSTPPPPSPPPRHPARGSPR